MKTVVRPLCSIHSYVYMPEWSGNRAPSAAAAASSAGYTHMVVPLRNFEAIDPAAIAKTFEANQLSPVNSVNLLPHADLSSLDPDIRHRGIERVRQGLRLARDMGSHHVGGVLYGVLRKHERPATSEQLKHAAHSLSVLAEEAKVMGIRLAIEIVNRYESNLINTVDQALNFLRSVGSDNVFLHLDTFHMNIEEADMRRALEAALPVLAYFELDQNNRGRPDQGAIDFDPLLSLLFASGYDDIVGIEAFSRNHISEEIGGAIGIWRDLFDYSCDVADAGIALINDARERSKSVSQSSAGLCGVRSSERALKVSS
ncbi:sugar phosphate isomerase/epimerase family protein [Variovorax rhizosphaerae]|uniref:Sugar phosphate isomerase/epimerase family protein n=1 Tax=Variovorax rhizosphaerae TaxID=1836200 RepID=A0ABU8WR95_9BURK